jgi:hypothetical protein
MRILLLLLAVIGISTAREVEGRQVPDQADLAGQQVPLRGADMLTWKWIVDLYVVALYVPSTTTDCVAASPKRLRCEYARSFTREQMVEATNKTIGRGLTAEQVAALQPALIAWNALYPAPAKGDVVDFDHLPGGVLVMRHNGTELGRVSDEAFAQALFAIWIGKEPVKESVRDELVRAR